MLHRAAQVICTKVRDGDKRIVRLKEGTPKGRHVVIVDDLVQSGAGAVEFCFVCVCSFLFALPRVRSPFLQRRRVSVGGLVQRLKWPRAPLRILIWESSYLPF